MKKYAFTRGGKTYCRVNKMTARKLYEQGVYLYTCPCNMRPENCYYRERICCKQLYPYGNTFDEIVAVVTGYNCFCKETGRYLAYYVEEGIL